MREAKECPVCTTMIEVPAECEGEKIECAHCHSIHRVRGAELKVLIEELDYEPVRAEVRPQAGPSPSAAPKLKTRRDKFREEMQESYQGTGSSNSRGRSSRRRGARR